jgi:hypothetical protein
MERHMPSRLRRFLLATVTAVVACTEAPGLYMTEGVAKAHCGDDEVVSVIQQNFQSCARQTSWKYGLGTPITGTPPVYGCLKEIEARLRLYCSA